MTSEDKQVSEPETVSSLLLVSDKWSFSKLVARKLVSLEGATKLESNKYELYFLTAGIDT